MLLIIYVGREPKYNDLFLGLRSDSHWIPITFRTDTIMDLS